MSLSERLSEDFKKALKAGDRDVVSAIRMVKAAVKNREIEKRSSLDDEEIHGVLMSLARQCKDSIEQFSRGGRQDLAEKEARELSIIRSYLPQQLTEEELKKIIADVIREVGASDKRDAGRVMKTIMPRLKGKADGRLVSELVQKVLADGSSVTS